MPEKYSRPHSHERVQAVEWREQNDEREALAAVRRFNAMASTGCRAWFFPTVAAALASKHHWLVVVCDACDTVVDLDLRVKRRDPDASVRCASAMPALQRARKAEDHRTDATGVDIKCSLQNDASRPVNNLSFDLMFPRGAT
jgi:hypothetical protein